ncbi:uncharacterized protein SOCEGT47_004980 [Sorangium cellulosum]|uniref:Uncharacterized protein n=1 Tax=Sorangium cellulosum TaxID=56 RepID=A0A4P2PTJ4_SORCE|nr:hypothetical protein [Sorangium cellulosum]AUX20035.1 uncharacterized protein SOCEGT47_004980 [Sorangium cellulosum]
MTDAPELRLPQGVTVSHELRLTPTYAARGWLYAGAAGRAGLLSPGLINVIAPGIAQSARCKMNANFGISGLGSLYAALDVKEDDVLTVTINAPATITILSHKRAPTRKAPPERTSRGPNSSPGVPRWMATRLRNQTLGDEHRQFISGEIAKLIPVAADQSHSSWRTARFLIDSLLWCWTADGIDDRGEACRDRLKYDCLRQFHTVDARKRWEQNRGRGTGLRHEHAVPRNQLITRMLSRGQHPTQAEVNALLCRLCFAVVVTVEEDDELKAKGLKDCLPDGWDWNAEGDQRLLRYARAGLIDVVRQPSSTG